MLIYNLFFISKQCYGCFLASKGPTTIAEVVNCRNQDAVSSQIPLDPEGFSNARIWKIKPVKIISCFNEFEVLYLAFLPLSVITSIRLTQVGPPDAFSIIDCSSAAVRSGSSGSGVDGHISELITKRVKRSIPFHIAVEKKWILFK